MIPTSYLRQVPIFVPDSGYCTGYRVQQWWSSDSHINLSPNDGGDGEWRYVQISQETV